MAKLWITELAYMPGMSQVAQLPPIAEQVVTFTTTTTQSAAANHSTRFVRVISDADCHIAVGDNPTATTSSLKLIAGSPEYFGVGAGQKIAAVTAA